MMIVSETLEYGIDKVHTQRMSLLVESPDSRLRHTSGETLPTSISSIPSMYRLT